MVGDVFAEGAFVDGGFAEGNFGGGCFGGGGFAGGVRASSGGSSSLGVRGPLKSGLSQFLEKGNGEDTKQTLIDVNLTESKG